MTFGAGDLGHVAEHNTIRTDKAALGTYSAWTPTLTNFPATLAWARYKQIGDTVKFRYVATLTGAATGTMSVSLPVQANLSYAGDTIGVASVYGVSNNYTGFVVMAGGTPSVMQFAGAGGVGSGGVWAGSIPITWAAGALIRAWGEYEAA